VVPAAAQKEPAHEHSKQQAGIFAQNVLAMHLWRWRISRFPRAAGVFHDDTLSV